MFRHVEMSVSDSAVAGSQAVVREILTAQIEARIVAFTSLDHKCLCDSSNAFQNTRNGIF